MKAILYVKKEEPYLYDLRNIMGVFEGYNVKQAHLDHLLLNGKIIAECDFNIDKIEYKHIKERDKFGILHNESWYECKGLNVSNYECDLASRSGFQDDGSLFDYLFDYLDCEDGYAIHVNNLNVFNEPRELSDYEYVRRVKGEPVLSAVLFEAPQNMQKIIANGTDAILITLQSQEMCRILNKEQDVLIRRNVLKEMK